MDTLDICNKIRLQAEGLSDNGVPIDVLPKKVQQIILDFATQENYMVEYSFASLLSAAATAIGNSYHIRVKSNWVTNAALYMILVGRAGLGKTPPLEAMYKPIRELDKKRFLTYITEMEALNMNKEDKKSEDAKKPKLIRTIVSDFTPEALMRAHDDNQRGIVILVDEILGMFNTVNQYSRGQLIEQLLTAFSGVSLNIIRVNNPIPIFIETPCINIIGTIQTKLVHELFKKGYEDNGLLDRILFVLPKTQRISAWANMAEVSDAKPMAAQHWATILNKILSLEYAGKDGEKPKPTVISMTEEAKNHFRDWCNQAIDKINDTPNDADVKNRTMKQFLVVAKLALTIQVLRWACGESHLQYVDLESVKSAIRIDEFFEDSYTRLEERVVEERLDPQLSDMLELLPMQFETKQAVAIGEQQGLALRTVMNHLASFIKAGAIKKIRHGVYQKLIIKDNN